MKRSKKTQKHPEIYLHNRVECAEDVEFWSGRKEANIFVSPI